jgi:hypothetical protein
VVSREIRRILHERALGFNIALDDVSITNLTFGREFTAAIEAKQVAAQEAERAKFVVEKAEQDKRSAIIRAQVLFFFKNVLKLFCFMLLGESFDSCNNRHHQWSVSNSSKDDKD